MKAFTLKKLNFFALPGILLGLMLLVCILPIVTTAEALPAAGTTEIEAASLPSPQHRTMMVWVETSEAPPAITLRWTQPPSAGNILIFRKSKEAASWGNPIATLLNSARYFRDANVLIGQAYEYRVSNGENEGYVFAGIRVAATQHRGTVILLVESERAEALTDALKTFKLDLVGDGWTVRRHNVSRNATPEAARALVQADFNADPDNVSAVFLIGRIPIFFSGSLAPVSPDGHPPRPFAADAFYGSMTGDWVNFSTQNIAADVELMVGRVDFDDIHGFGKNASELLIQYLEKNHRYRHGLMPASRDGLIDDGLRDVAGAEAFAQNAYRLFPALWGAEADIAVGGWANEMSDNSFTWAHINGGGTHSSVNASTQLNSGILANSSINTNAIFWQMFGSFNGDWADHAGNAGGDNLLMSTLAMPDFGLAAAWTGRPNWFFHHMALGETIGFSTRLTQNNTSLYTPTGAFPTRAHVGLLGDPTLRMFPVLPATNAAAAFADGSVRITWDRSADNAVTAYYIYGSESLHGPFVRLAVVGNVNEWNHENHGGTRFYMVRARKLQVTGSGSFYNLAQGAFAQLQTYSVTVAGGTADRSTAYAGAVVTITADTPAQGSVFGRWVSENSTVTFTNQNAASTTFIMPSGNITVTAMFDDTFTVTVNGGLSNMSAGAAGTTIVLFYGTPPDGKRFAGWRVVSGDVTIVNNSFVIGTSDVVIDVVWQDVRACGCGSIGMFAGSGHGTLILLGILFISASLIIFKKKRVLSN